MWAEIVKFLSGLLIGIPVGYLVRPFMEWIYPQARLERHLVISLNGEAQLFMTGNRLEIPLLSFKSILPFKVILTLVRLEVLVAGVAIGTTDARQTPQQLRKAEDTNLSFYPLQITELGRQQIATIRQTNAGTDFVGATASVKVVVRTFYNERATSRDFNMPIHVMN